MNITIGRGGQRRWSGTGRSAAASSLLPPVLLPPVPPSRQQVGCARLSASFAPCPLRGTLRRAGGLLPAEGIPRRPAGGLLPVRPRDHGRPRRKEVEAPSPRRAVKPCGERRGEGR